MPTGVFIILAEVDQVMGPRTETAARPTAPAYEEPTDWAEVDDHSELPPGFGWGEFNPQPEPPADIVKFGWEGFNPQPEPPPEFMDDIGAMV